jgi:hypothetical protein
MRDDEETVEDAKGQRSDGEEVHRNDGFSMITQKWTHHFAGSGLLYAFSIQRETVRSVTSKPSIINSP